MGEITFITGYVLDERDKLIKMYEKFNAEKRCCGLPPVGKESIEVWIDELFKKDTRLWQNTKMKL